MELYLAEPSTGASSAAAEDVSFLYWVSQRLYEEARARWTQIEGLHSRATYTLTVVLGFAAFTAAGIRPLDGGRAIAFVLCVLVPVGAGVLGVLMPRLGTEPNVDNLWGEDRLPFPPVKNLTVLANSLRRLVAARDEELDSKGRFLVLAQVVALLGIVGMLILLATVPTVAAKGPGG